MVERNELLPRVSNLTSFITEEEFNKIPRDILEVKAAEGIRKHKIIEDNYYNISTDNVISWLFHKGIMQIFPGDETQDDPAFEEQINGERFTGRPDFRLWKTIIDYKFTDELRPVTALKIVLYGMLEKEVNGIDIDRFYAFHYPEDFTLFIHKVPDRTIMPLVTLAGYIIENHESIKAGHLEKYEALNMWDKLLQDYDVFEPVGTELLPPSTIKNNEEAITSILLSRKIDEIIKYQEKLKSNIKQYMIENDLPKISDISGYGIRLQYNNKKLYNTGRKAAAKKIYDEALSKCQTGTFETTSLVRFAPRKNKVKLIN
jgi:hypothetical protein